jgi:EAL domain-containing protein (putative c-di-GMP-specific phosphodiesterase class I)
MDQDRPEALLRDADVALYRAKSQGKARYAVFDQSMNAHALERLDLETDLRRAVERHELRVFYHPIVDLASGRVCELEALVRWQHPQRGVVPPLEFIPLAEETGLIVPIGQWVLEEACRQVKVWQAEIPGCEDLAVSVNLSARQFQHPALVDDIAQVLRETGLDPTMLRLEITESVVMEDAEATTITLRALKSLGTELVIDDFGTGYSSLSYLSRFSIDALKIDRSFVAKMGHSSHDMAIVQGIVALSKSLTLSVTGEGIERPEELEQLRALGCDRGQGYYFAKPLPGEVVASTLPTIVCPRPAARLAPERARSATSAARAVNVHRELVSRPKR